MVKLIGGIQAERATLLDSATAYVAGAIGDGLRYDMEPGALRRSAWITFDLLNTGDHMLAMALRLVVPGEVERAFRFGFKLLPRAQARLRLPLSATDQNRWLLKREGALLKPLVSGDVIDPTDVARIELLVDRKPPGEVRWEQTELRISQNEPPLLDSPLLPDGPLLDEFGQATWRDWPGKTRSEGELIERLTHAHQHIATHRWPDAWSSWGGWQNKQFAATGYFRTEQEGDRWWLVDPAGCAFWSTGCDCVRSIIATGSTGFDSALKWSPIGKPGFEQGHNGDEPNYLATNLIRAFGADCWHERWAELAIGALRQCGFNTVGNWSEYDIARQAVFPYVRPMKLTWQHTPMVFRDFPDVFDPALAADATAFAEQLSETRGDRAMIGYFLMNEPTWGFAAQTPGEGMLINTPRCRTRAVMADHLRQRYGSSEAWAKAWGIKASLDDVAGGEWRWPINPAARVDLEQFSTVMVKRLYDALSQACRRIDPDHLNLGARYFRPPPTWALLGMDSFDVFSINGYGETIRHEEIAQITKQVSRPVMIGEWHFGALDVGLPGSGIGHVATQADRGRAYRRYIEDAATDPNCIGVHWFTLYDQAAIGRGDGEPYNIGFLDTCGRLYDDLVQAARTSHERLYAVRSGEEKPFGDAPEYLPMLF